MISEIYLRVFLKKYAFPKVKNSLFSNQFYKNQKKHSFIYQFKFFHNVFSFGLQLWQKTSV